MPPKAPQTQQDNSLDIDLVRQALEADYEVLEELGRGGMAVVYRAKERALDREVAIKVLPSFMSMDTAFVERFQHEAVTAGKLEHPNIVPIYRVGRTGRVIYFVMKFLRGQSLASVLRERVKLTVPEIRRILIETSSALGYASRRSVVHRDIKPDNILLDDEGRCVVTDFGIAKSSGGPLTAAGTSMGTPRYMSPEHARGIALDGRSDMYSMGVVAYQCLTGATPFDADDPFAILYKHINEPLPHPVLTTDEEKEIYPVIERMLAKQPEDRFQNAEELVAALGGIPQSSAATLISTPIGGATVTTVPSRPLRRSGISETEIIGTPSLRTRVRRAWNNPRVWWGAAGVVVLALFVRGARSASVSKSAAPAAVAGATTTALVGATTRVVAPGDTAAARLAGGAGTTTGATTGVRVAAITDSVPKAATKTTPTVRRITPTPVSASVRASGARVSASKCPTSSRPDTAFVVLVDSVSDKKATDKLTVDYDVCRLTLGAPFQATFQLRKLNQGRFRKQDPRNVGNLETAIGPRSRHRFVLDLAGLSAGRYALDVVVRNAKGHDVGKTREFQITER